ncbi:MAG: prepilin-type N-terminal cleavage/methylation domain-containing protein [Thermodesulfobacteriota bacterium]|nr:MAG: prepilin-type N-terminal cleavage/methylation domain-containing protein [Thermodesulfobacteriota bacterium]
MARMIDCAMQGVGTRLAKARRRLGTMRVYVVRRIDEPGSNAGMRRHDALYRRRQAKGPPRADGLERVSAHPRTPDTHRSRSPALPLSHGFSLLELIAVIAIIGITLAFVLPRFPSLDGRRLESDADRLALLASFIGERAVATRSQYRLHFDMAGAAVRVEASADGKEFTRVTEPVARGGKLSPGVEIGEVFSPGLGRISRGEAFIHITSRGSDPFEVTLLSDGKRAVVSYNPYTGKASVSYPGTGEGQDG